MKTDLTYTQAMHELDAIVNEIENEDISVDQLSQKVKQASVLIKICQDALKTTTSEVKEILTALEKKKED